MQNFYIIKPTQQDNQGLTPGFGIHGRHPFNPETYYAIIIGENGAGDALDYFLKKIAIMSMMIL